MRLTTRDLQLIKDVALSHVLSRDQIIELGYFATVTRVNTRLRELSKEGLVQRLATPFFNQGLYSVGSKATPILGLRIAPLVAGRTGSPRFIQHALCVTNARLGLLKRGTTAWKFEQQLWSQFDFRGKTWEVRPDGLAITPKGPIAVEVDLGHVAPAKFAHKLRAYEAFAASGQAAKQWGHASFKVLVIASGKLRAARLSKLFQPTPNIDFRCVSFNDFGLPEVGSWS